MEDLKTAVMIAVVTANAKENLSSNDWKVYQKKVCKYVDGMYVAIIPVNVQADEYSNRLLTAMNSPELTNFCMQNACKILQVSCRNKTAYVTVSFE